MLRFAANLTTLFTERPFPERFAAARSAGFAEVEFLFPYAVLPDELRRTAALARVRVALFNAPAGDWEAGERGLACLAGRERDFRDAIDQALPYVEALECPCLHVMAGLGAPDAATDARYVANLRWAADRLAAVKASVLIEPISRASMPGYYLHSQAQGLDLLRRIDRANAGLQFDCFHAASETPDVPALLAACLPMVRHIQIASFPDRREPVSAQPDYPALFALLEDWGYAGAIGCEYHPAGRTEDGLGWLPVPGGPAAAGRSLRAGSAPEAPNEAPEGM